MTIVFVKNNSSAQVDNKKKISSFLVKIQHEG